jgi:hypothetical protein
MELMVKFFYFICFIATWTFSKILLKADCSRSFFSVRFIETNRKLICVIWSYLDKCFGICGERKWGEVRNWERESEATNLDTLWSDSSYKLDVFTDQIISQFRWFWLEIKRNSFNVSKIRTNASQKYIV